ncbi:MAG: VCBS repeat-containing protein [Sedimentisphaerales bacterium]|nr:VCBS repeat-containing protein [Sedimentisphaerales bacterium]
MTERKSILIALTILSISTITAYAANPTLQVIKVDVPPLDVEDSAGGILAADVNNDNKPDYLVTVQGHLAVYGNSGEKLWLKKTDIAVGGQSESQGLPGHHGPGTAAGDVDNDGKIEVIYLTKDSVLHIVDGATGKEEFRAKPPVPEGAARWELAMIADFRGTGKDNDILLQATNKSGYRTGRYLAAYEIDMLLKGGRPLWTTDGFISCAHNGARLADLDGDGKDEVLGVTIFSPAGKLITRAIEDRYHADSIFVADVKPELPGLEMVMLEEGANQVQVIALTGPVWRNHFKKQEPQNAAVGKFKENSDEIFIWCRSRYNEHQKPFVFDSEGNKVFDYEMDNVAPEGWTASGVEVIHTIDWTGRKQQLACAKERHTSGDVCLFEPLTGKFVLRLPEKTDRLYVADTTGDWREEIIVLNNSELHIYTNKNPYPRPDHKRLWTNRNYRRLKQCYNYYSP